MSRGLPKTKQASRLRLFNRSNKAMLFTPVTFGGPKPPKTTTTQFVINNKKKIKDQSEENFKNRVKDLYGQGKNMQEISEICERVTDTGKSLILRGFAGIKEYAVTKFDKNFFSERRIGDVLKAYGLKKWTTVFSPFSYRFNFWVERKCVEIKTIGNIDIYGSLSINEKRGVEMTLRHCNALYKIKEGVYYLDYVEGFGDSRLENKFIVFSHDTFDWTKERIGDFFIRFSKELCDFHEQAHEKMMRKDAFDSIFFPKELIDEIRRDTDEFITGKKVYEDLNLPWKFGMMLIGPPGNGKTLLIKKICDYYGLDCQDIKKAVSQDGTVSLDRIAEGGELDTLLYPAEDKPVVCILEDIDKFTTFQGGSGEHQDAGRVSLHALLNGLDGIEKVSGIIVIATTNYASTISEALINRPGRFDRVFQIDKPQLLEILKLFKYYKLEIKDGDLEAMAKKLVGYSMAFATDFVTSLYKRHKRKQVSLAEAESIIERIQDHNKRYKKHFEKDAESLGFSK